MTIAVQYETHQQHLPKRFRCRKRTTVCVSSELGASKVMRGGNDTLTSRPSGKCLAQRSFVRLAAKETPFTALLTIGDNYS